MIVSKVSRYHPALVVLHWAPALLIIAALALGALVMVKIPNTDPMKFEALRSHMSGGMAILVLMLIRLVIRSRSAHPDPATAGHPLLDKLAWASHRNGRQRHLHGPSGRIVRERFLRARQSAR
jgi:cytochrome b561